MLAVRTIVVRAVWDDEAGVWVAESDNLAGLITEADTLDSLVEKLKVLIPELIEENEGDEHLPAIPFQVMVDRLSTGGHDRR